MRLVQPLAPGLRGCNLSSLRGHGFAPYRYSGKRRGSCKMSLRRSAVISIIGRGVTCITVAFILVTGLPAERSTIRRWSIARRLFVANLLFILALTAIVGTVAFVDARDRAYNDAGQRMQAVAAAIAANPLVLQAAGTSNPSAILQPYAQVVTANAHADFITIMAPTGRAGPIRAPTKSANPISAPSTLPSTGRRSLRSPPVRSARPSAPSFPWRIHPVKSGPWWPQASRCGRWTSRYQPGSRRSSPSPWPCSPEAPWPHGCWAGTCVRSPGAGDRSNWRNCSRTTSRSCTRSAKAWS